MPEQRHLQSEGSWQNTTAWDEGAVAPLADESWDDGDVATVRGVGKTA